MLAQDAKGNVCALVYFGKASYTAKKLLPVGEKRWVAGKLEQYDQWLQIVHPDHVAEDSAGLMGHLVEPVYSLAEGLTQPKVANLAQQALARAPELPEWIEPGVLDRHKWPAWRDALVLAHRAEHPAARDRLAYDELLANSLALMLVRADNRKRRGQPLQGDGRLRGKLALPFPLTGAQTALDRRDRRRPGASLADAAPAPGRRRLGQDRGRARGDAGRGRGRRAGGDARADRDPRPPALRHAARRWPGRPGVNVALLTGRDKGRARESILMGLVDGSIDIVVGTHAIFQESGRLQEPRAGGDRRAAPLRRQPAAAADAEGPRHAALPGDDRHADPAHADARAIRRDGRQPARRDAARAARRSTRAWSRSTG